MNDFESFMNYITKTPYNSNPKIISGMVNSIINTNLDEYEERVFGKIAEYHPEDNLTLLELDKSYESLLVRSDWPDVSVYCFDSDNNGAVCRLVSSEEDSNEEPLDEINLSYLIDNQNGMPVPVLKITINGEKYTCYSTQFHDTDQTYAASWYSADDTRLDSAPSLVNMIFDYLIIGNNQISNLASLSDEQKTALEALSRIVNISIDAMGSLGTIDNGVERLGYMPKVGKRYAFSTNKDIVFQLPNIEWSKEKREFWLDLDCTSSISLTFSYAVCYEDGNNIDTTQGKHRLHFYVPADADTWTVAETESYTEITEDYLPEYTIPFRNCTADQIRAVLKLGYSDGNGNWCVRRKNGIVQTWFSIGDTHSVTLTDGQEVTMRIIGIQYDDIPNGGKAALTCDFAEVLSTGSTAVYGDSYTYQNSGFRIAAKSMRDLFPDWLRALNCTAEKEVGSTVTVYDYVWAFKSEELSGDAAYPFFTDNISRIRIDLNGEQSSWTIRQTGLNNSVWSQVTTGGSISNIGADSSETVSTIAVGFCLNA